MGNCLSKEIAEAKLQDDNSVTIGIIKKVYKAFLLGKKRLADMVYSRRDQWSEDEKKKHLMTSTM